MQEACIYSPAVHGVTAPPGAQAAARQAGVPADSLAFECDVRNGETPLEAAPSGVHIKVVNAPRMLQALRLQSFSNCVRLRFVCHCLPNTACKETLSA